MNITGGDNGHNGRDSQHLRQVRSRNSCTEMKLLLGQGKYLELGLLAHKAKGSVTVMGMDDTSKMLKELRTTHKIRRTE
ncbi:MAG: hypothetical protein MZV63_01050 [Marinilabiliales bacterium]|nr:hypothetical protein [Marinilabiliales bacterium]